jgi:hypothetical protein
MLRDRIRDEDVRLSDVITSLKVIFTVSDEDIMTIVDEWADSQSTLLNNRLVEIQERLYKKGITIQLSPEQINTLIDDEDKRFQLMTRIPL